MRHHVGVQADLGVQRLQRALPADELWVLVDGAGRCARPGGRGCCGSELLERVGGLFFLTERAEALDLGGEAVDESSEAGDFGAQRVRPLLGLERGRGRGGQAGGYEDLKLKPVSTSEYPTATQRPLNSVLDCSLIEKDYGIRQVSWSDELRRII